MNRAKEQTHCDCEATLALAEAGFQGLELDLPKTAETLLPKRR